MIISPASSASVARLAGHSAVLTACHSLTLGRPLPLRVVLVLHLPLFGIIRDLFAHVDVSFALSAPRITLASGRIRRECA